MYKFKIEKSYKPKLNQYESFIFVDNKIVHDEILKLVFSYSEIERHYGEILSQGQKMESIINYDNKNFKVEWIKSGTPYILNEFVKEVEEINYIWTTKIHKKSCEINFFEDCKKCLPDCYKK